VQRAVLAWLLALGLVAATLGVAVADPLATPPDREPVDLAGPPAEALERVLRTTETRDYTVSLAFRDEAGTGETRTVVQVENSEREVLGRSAGDGPETLTYANEHVGFRGRPGDLERGAGTWDDHNAPLGHLDALDGTDVTRTAANGTTTFRVAADAAAKRLVGYDAGVRGNATLTAVVDTEQRRLERLTFERRWTEDGERERRGAVWRFSDWGETDVKRPPGAGYSLAEFLYDATA